MTEAEDQALVEAEVHSVVQEADSAVDEAVAASPQEDLALPEVVEMIDHARCLMLFAIIVESHAKYLLGQQPESRCTAVTVLKKWAGGITTEGQMIDQVLIGHDLKTERLDHQEKIIKINLYLIA